MTRDHLILWGLIFLLVWIISPLIWGLIIILIESLRNPGEFYLEDSGKMAKELANHLRKDWFFNICTLPLDLLMMISTFGRRKRW